MSNLFIFMYGPSISKVQENQEFSISQTIDLDVIDTQESIHVKQMLAPFNPNQKYLDVDKVNIDINTLQFYLHI